MTDNGQCTTLAPPPVQSVHGPRCSRLCNLIKEDGSSAWPARRVHKPAASAAVCLPVTTRLMGYGCIPPFPVAMDAESAAVNPSTFIDIN